MKILVIGGAGFLGANLVRRCLGESPRQVTVMDSLDPHFHSSTKSLEEVWEDIKFVRGDLRDDTLLADLVQGKDLIFNCAAQTSHPMSVRYPLLDAEINCLGNLKLLEAVRAVNRDATVVYTSSSTVIGKAEQEVIDEGHGEQPREIYSANKSVAEKYYEIYHTMHDLKTVILRFANLFGPFGKGYPEFGFVNYFISQALTNADITIYGDGAQVRNVMYVEDAADILWQASQEPRLYGQPYFATSDTDISVADIAQTIVRVFDCGTITHIEWPDERRRMEIGDVVYSSARLRDVTGWVPRYDLVSGLEHMKARMDAEVLTA